MSGPHDALARHVFSNEQRAASEFRVVLGPQISALIDWSTLHLEPGQVEGEAIEALFPDLRFSARLQDMPVALGLMLEHQSTPDALMPVRFFRNNGGFWHEFMRNHPGQKVPLVINVLLAQGERPWPTAPELWTAIDGGERLRQLMPHLIPSLPVLTDDLAAATDAEIRARPQDAFTRLALLMMKHSREPQLAQSLAQASDLALEVDRQPGGRVALVEVGRYILRANDRVGPEELRTALAPALGRGAEEIAMTAGEQLIQQGLQQGLQKGLQQGLQQGQLQARASVVLEVLSTRGLAIPPSVRARIVSCADVSVLSRWLQRALTMSSAEDVVAD
jgi:predicted transposase YdaD